MLRDQPYLPLYVDRFAGDEKLRDCSASAHGVLIRLMCLLHKAKSTEYGTILLKNELKKKLIKEVEKNFAQANGQHVVDHVADSLVEVLVAPPSDILVRYFALQFDTQFPFSLEIIEQGLFELHSNEVIFFDGYYICQKGMIKQGNISGKRSVAGKKGVQKKKKIEKAAAIKQHN